MASGIIAHGTHIPYWRLPAQTVSSALGSGATSGARSVASYDEDTTTMAVEAGRAVLTGRDRAGVDSITLATGTPTYAAKTNATAVHAALSLPRHASAMDVGGAERSAFAALVNAMRLPGSHLVVLSDLSIATAGSPEEIGSGDGAVAFLVGAGEGEPSVELLSAASVTDEFLDRWKAPGEPITHTWEERFGQEIYQRLGAESLRCAVEKAGVEVGDLTQYVCTGLSPRAVKPLARSTGTSSILAADLTSEIGRAGVAHVGIALADVVERSHPGDLIAVTMLADGAETVILRVSGIAAEGGESPGDAQSAINSSAQAGQVPTVRSQIEGGNDDLRYTDFLNWKGLLDKVGPRRPAPARATAPPSHREVNWKFGFTADLCTECDTRNLPPQRVCLRCGAVDAMRPEPMADVPGTIATFTVDHLAFSPAPPVIGVVIDFDGGGRFSCQLTDVDPSRVAIGQRVTMTFRVMSEAAGISNYFWKARPLQGTSEDSEPAGRNGK